MSVVRQWCTRRRGDGMYLDVTARVHGQVAREWHRQIVPHAQQLASLPWCKRTQTTNQTTKQQQTTNKHPHHPITSEHTSGAGQGLSATHLVSQVVHKLAALLAVLAHQRRPQLEHGRVDLHCAVALEHRLPGARQHTRRQVSTQGMLDTAPTRNALGWCGSTCRGSASARGQSRACPWQSWAPGCGLPS